MRTAGSLLGEDLAEAIPSGDEGAPRGRGRSTFGLSRWAATGFLTPSIVLIGVFLAFPAIWTLYLGITNYTLFGFTAAHPHIVGTQNYSHAVSNPQFLNSLRVTVVYVLSSAVIGQCVLGFALAWKLRDWHSWVRQALEGLVIVAWIVPSVVVAFLWIAYLDPTGTVDRIGGVGINWLLHYPLQSLVVFNVWRGTAFSMMLFAAAMQTVPPSYLETARLAGASGWAQLRDIILPSTKGHILTDLLLITLWTFNDFTPYLLTQGGPIHQTDVLGVYVYQQAFNVGAMGYGAAISTIMLVINLLIAVVYLRLLRRRT
ncbi:MAG: carbohydrate ABC transporter permease [Acidimicrobiales bacterium]